MVLDVYFRNSQTSIVPCITSNTASLTSFLYKYTHTTSPCTRLPAFTFPQNPIYNTNIFHFQPMIVSTRNNMKIEIRGGAIYTGKVKYISIFQQFLPNELCMYAVNKRTFKQSSANLVLLQLLCITNVKPNTLRCHHSRYFLTLYVSTKEIWPEKYLYKHLNLNHRHVRRRDITLYGKKQISTTEQQHNS